MTLQNCQTIVLDEVDLLLGINLPLRFAFANRGVNFLGEFSDFRESLMQALAFVLDTTQFFLATATIPEHTYRLLQETFHEMTFVVGPGLHCTAPGVMEQLVDCSGGDVVNEETGQARKLEALSSLIDTEKEATARRTVIFCNKIETCRKVPPVTNLGRISDISLPGGELPEPQGPKRGALHSPPLPFSCGCSQEKTQSRDFHAEERNPTSHSDRN